MRSIKNDLIKITNFFVIVLLISSCTITTSKEKNLEFKVDLAAVDSSLKTLVVCQNATISGFQKTTNGQTFTEIQVKIINGLNLPAKEADLKNLAKKIASQVKHIVKNQDEFNNYKVFLVEQSKGAVGSVSKWKSWSFKSEEI